MIVGFSIAPKSLTLATTTALGELITTRDATWRVGSGQSLAAAIQDLIGSSLGSIEDCSRLIIIDGGGSYTTARTTFAFVTALAWTRSLPVTVIPPLPDESLTNGLRRAAALPATIGPIEPTYNYSHLAS